MEQAPNKSVFVLDLTTKDESKLAKYRFFLTEYFHSIGATEVNFISSTSSQDDAIEEIQKAGLVYIPGGNTELLLDNIRLRQLVPLIRKLDSVVVGNSAGALAVCNVTVLTKDEDVHETKTMSGVGLVPFAVDVHYTADHDSELINLSHQLQIYGIPENCAIVYHEQNRYIGDIFSFLNGHKEKIH